MPTTSLSINGVPYTDTQNFLAEFERVMERYRDDVERRLEEWVHMPLLDEDEYHTYLHWEAVRVPKFGSTHTQQRRISKEVK